jgi:hypothetical protein
MSSDIRIAYYRRKNIYIIVFRQAVLTDAGAWRAMPLLCDTFIFFNNRIC